MFVYFHIFKKGREMANIKEFYKKHGVVVAAGLFVTGLAGAFVIAVSNPEREENTTRLNITQKSITRLTEEIAKNPIVPDTLYDAQGNIKEIRSDTTYVLSNQDFKDLEQVKNDINALGF